MSDFQIDKMERFDDRICVLHLSGALDAMSSDVLLERLYGLHSNGERKIVLEMSKLSRISAAGAGVFLEIGPVLKESGGWLKLWNLAESVFNSLNRIGVTALYPPIETLDQVIGL